MLCNIKCCAVTLVLILLFSIARLSIPKCTSVANCLEMPEGCSKTPPSDYGKLKNNLRDFNWTSIFNETGVKIEKIDSAYHCQPSVRFYTILADIVVDHHNKKCCLRATETPHGEFWVNCVQCDK